ncbi:hypothetical protein SAMN05660841_03299 [Sphingobacterium nematocida]|uniref:Uncharacterized protein n=1 Tax=Sphingobacterium nematocida TaxID=1513896 RepID=A0A1T5FIL3_9SPHI|nr:hypothetical protein [Sphingobacterium nematocida]SKB96011.1 hypothetical protein SAMN05660841_03299 [Sphingobacterium nematocida]
MKKLFASKDIRIQEMEDLYGGGINIAYTSKLLQLNVLIEFFGVSIEGDPYVYEEVGVYASIYEDGIVHSYVLFISGETLGPLPTFRLIADAVDFIEACDQYAVKEDLKGIAMSYSAIDSKVYRGLGEQERQMAGEARNEL